jgi:gamma-glutamyltranspeptidase
MYVTQPLRSRVGGLAVAIPGELKGLEFAWQRVWSNSIFDFDFFSSFIFVF